MGIIIKPLVTEKMTAITEKLNRFGFIVILKLTSWKLRVRLKLCIMLQ